MKYCSTRGGESSLSFKDVLFSGYAKDGGLYMPEEIPQLSPEEVASLAGTSYHSLVWEVTRRFIAHQELPSDDLRDLINTSLHKFTIPEVVKVSRLDGGLNIAELFHGPTLAFKDMALSVVAALINYYLKQSQEHITILVGTSGDTGSAALESVRGDPCTDIVVLLPYGRCTRTQELQMTTIIENNCHIYRVEGTSDDLDEPIKRCFSDSAFVSTHGLISLNSINWGRILVQVAHYFYCYYQLCEEAGGLVELVVPTGAAGNITAGCIAHKMGLPIKLVVAVNTNDILGRTLSCGDFSIKGNVMKSLAPAMDIKIAYNMERLLHLFSGGSVERVRSLMQQFERDSCVQLPQDILDQVHKVVIETFVADDAMILATMKRVYKENEYVICPHTAVAVAFHYQRGPRNVPRVCLATAAPDKFSEAVAEAEIPAAAMHNLLHHLESQPTRSMWMRHGEDWDAILRAKVEEITARRKGKAGAGWKKGEVGKKE